jgi:hypothetical protein
VDTDRFESAGGYAARVTRTGIALVHEGELVLPAAGSEAEAEIVDSDSRSVIHYYFPVEIEVRASGGEIDIDEIVDRTLDRFAQSMSGL